MHIHSNLYLVSRLKPNYEGPSKLWDVNPEDVDLDTPECLMANLSLASPSLEPFSIEDLDEASMPRSSSVIAGSSVSVVGGKLGSTSHATSSSRAASYRQCGDSGGVPLEDVEDPDYVSD